MKPQILDYAGEIDLRPWLEEFSEEAGIPLELALACAIAESGLDTKAEHMGVWPDVSFGLGQRIVKFHYIGNHSNTPENIDFVREYVFSHPDVDIQMMCWKLASCLAGADGDELNALVIYNAGHLPDPRDPWWIDWADNVENYKRALAEAKGILGG